MVICVPWLVLNLGLLSGSVNWSEISANDGRIESRSTDLGRSPNGRTSLARALNG